MSVSRSAAEIVGAGASSSTFWWRRWVEQSRSKRWSTVPVRVGEHLHLDVAGALDEALDEQRRVAECRARLAPRGGDGGGQLVRGPHDAHALAAAARGRLDHQRQADLVGGARGELVVRRVLDRRHDRHAGRHREAPRLVLAPHALDDVGRRADERQAGIGARAREVRVLGEEAVAGVDRLRARAPRGVEHGVDRQVRLARRRRPDAQRRVGLADVRGDAVGVGVDRDGPQPERARRAQHADRDLAAVCDQHRVEHHMRKTP